MRSLPENNFWNTLRTRLRNYEEAPASDDDNWELIAAALKPRQPFYKRRGFVALIALLLISTTAVWVIVSSQPTASVNGQAGLADSRTAIQADDAATRQPAGNRATDIGVTDVQNYPDSGGHAAVADNYTVDASVPHNAITTPANESQADSYATAAKQADQNGNSLPTGSTVPASGAGDSHAGNSTVTAKMPAEQNKNSSAMRNPASAKGTGNGQENGSGITAPKLQAMQNGNSSSVGNPASAGDADNSQAGNNKVIAKVPAEQGGNSSSIGNATSAGNVGGSLGDNSTPVAVIPGTQNGNSSSVGNATSTGNDGGKQAGNGTGVAAVLPVQNGSPSSVGNATSVDNVDGRQTGSSTVVSTAPAAQNGNSSIIRNASIQGRNAGNSQTGNSTAGVPAEQNISATDAGNGEEGKTTTVAKAPAEQNSNSTVVGNDALMSNAGKEPANGLHQQPTTRSADVAAANPSGAEATGTVSRGTSVEHPATDPKAISQTRATAGQDVNESTTASDGPHAIAPDHGGDAGLKTTSTNRIANQDHTPISADSSGTSGLKQGGTIAQAETTQLPANGSGQAQQSATDSTHLPKEPKPVEAVREAKAAAVAKKEQEQKKKNWRPVLYASLTPSLAFNKITPRRNDDIQISGLPTEGIFSRNRFGLSFETGAQVTLQKGFEVYGGFQYYQQNQSVSYRYNSSAVGQINPADEPLGYVITPQGDTRTFRYAMRNAGVSAGFLYTVKDARLMHKLGAGLQYQRGFMKARTDDTYTNSSSQYMNYQVHYRLEWAEGVRTRLYVQPAFIHAFWSDERLREPLTIKPYRVGITFGVTIAL